MPGINTGSKEPNSLVTAEAIPAFIPVAVWWILEIIPEPSTCFIQVSIPHIYIYIYAWYQQKISLGPHNRMRLVSKLLKVPHSDTKYRTSEIGLGPHNRKGLVSKLLKVPHSDTKYQYQPVRSKVNIWPTPEQTLVARTHGLWWHGAWLGFTCS